MGPVQCRSEESSLCGMGGWRWWVGGPSRSTWSPCRRGGRPQWAWRGSERALMKTLAQGLQSWSAPLSRAQWQASGVLRGHCSGPGPRGGPAVDQGNQGTAAHYRSTIAPRISCFKNVCFKASANSSLWPWAWTHTHAETRI